MATDDVIEVKVGDTPTLRWLLGRDITGATVRVVISSEPGGVPLVDRDGVVVDAATGDVSITLLAAETATEGEFLVEVKTTAGGTVLTHPSGGYGRVRFVRRLV